MAGSRVPRDDISPEMRRFLDDLSRTLTSQGETFTSTAAGPVPASGGGVINFLRADGSWVAPIGLFKVLTANENAQDVNTVQPWFPTAGAVTVAATTSYYMRGRLVLTGLGANARTIAQSFGGTATLTSIGYYAFQDDGAAIDTVGTLNDATYVTAASATVISTSDNTATIVVTLDGIIRINAAGTLIPQFTWSAAPSGTPVVNANSFFFLTPIGTNTVASQGTWA